MHLLEHQFITLTSGVYLFGIQQIVAEIGNAMITVSLMSFFMSICDTLVEGTYIAILT
jgi:hypothetical protein